MTYEEQISAIAKEVSDKHDAALAQYAPDSATPDWSKFEVAFAAYEAECWQRFAEVTPDNELVQMVASAKTYP